MDADGNPLTGTELTNAVDAYTAVDDGDDTDNLWYGCLINGQRDPLTVKLNGGKESTGIKLEQIVATSGIAPTDVTQLEVVSGELLAPDAVYMRRSLTALQKLTLTSATKFVLRLGYNNSLQEVDAPELVIVGDHVFYDCSALTTVSLPAATSIGHEAFQYCAALTTVNLPKATSIGNYAFDNCYALTTVNLPMATSIGDYAFHNCYALATVNLPMVTSIGGNAFGWCNALATVNLPEATDIGSEAFYGCNSLSTVSLPSVANIEQYAFDACYALTSLSLGAIPPTLGSDVFHRCPSPRFLQLVGADGNPLTGTELTNAVDAYTAEADGDDTDNLWYGWLINEPLPVQQLTIKVNGGSAISNKASLEEAIKASGESPDNVTQLEVVSGVLLGTDASYMRRSLTSLQKLTLTAAKEFGLKLSHTSLQEIYAPKLEIVGDYAFFDCDNLTTVKLPAAAIIGNSAFNDCNVLTSLELGANPPKVGVEAFDGCPSLRFLQLVDANGNPLTGAALNNAVEAYKTVDDGDMGDNLWYGWRIGEQPAELTIKVNGGSKSTGGSLRAIIESIGMELENVTQLEVMSGDLLAPDAAYMRRSLTSLQKLTLTTAKEFVLYLGYYGSLQEIHAPELEIIGANVFSECYALSTVDMPKATSIGNYAFEYCNALATVNLPKATHIGYAAFYECYALSTVDMPKASYIDNYAFYNCDALTKVDMPKATDIGYDAFYGCDALTTVDMPKATYIGDYAFYGCNALATVNLPEATSIGEEAFFNCDALTKVDMPKATDIGYGAFGNCDALTTVSLPAANNIGYYAFSNCSALTSLVLGATPPYVSSSFSGCPSPRYLSLVDADGNPLADVDRQAALAAYKSDGEWDSYENTWAGWSLMLSITATANPVVGGSISGTGSVAENATVTLEATPNEGYYFVRWTDGTNVLSTDNPYSFTATDDAELVAEFEVITYTLSYTTTTGGSISGTNPQIVAHGQSGTEVEAVPDAGYQFLRWDDGLITEKRTDANIKADKTVEAKFIDASINVYTLTYTAASGGSVRGAAKQRVVEGESGTEVQAVANTGRRFVGWSDGVTTAKRTDTDVTGDIEVEARFALISYTLTYTAGEGGSIVGMASQSVQHGKDGSEVEAVPQEGYRFVRWDDGVTTAKRTDTYVQRNISVKAEFEEESATGLFDIRRERLTAYPNPTTGMLWVSVPELVEGTAAEVHVYNTAGQLLQCVPARAASTGSAASRLSIDLSGYPAGIYIIRVGNARAKVVKK